MKVSPCASHEHAAGLFLLNEDAQCSLLLSSTQQLRNLSLGSYHSSALDLVFAYRNLCYSHLLSHQWLFPFSFQLLVILPFCLQTLKLSVEAIIHAAHLP